MVGFLGSFSYHEPSACIRDELCIEVQSFLVETNVESVLIRVEYCSRGNPFVVGSPAFREIEFPTWVGLLLEWVLALWSDS